MADRDVVAALIAYWQAQGLSVRPPDPGAVDSLQRRVPAALPRILREYYDTTDGIETDRKQFSFWRSKEVVQACTEPAVASTIDPALYIFADYFHVSWWYCIRIDASARNGEVALLDNSYCKVVARSFDEFLRLYLEDAEAILL